MAHADMPVSSTTSFSIGRLVPFLVLIAGLVVFFALGLQRYISFEVLRENREALLAWVQQKSLLAAISYIMIYAVAVAFSLPGGAVMSITGGFLFGTLWGALYIVIGATLGATALFIIAKTALGDPLRTRAGPWLQKMEAGFRENAMSYLLVLRLVPLFPFFVVNLVPAFLGVSLPTYVIGTFFGIIPGVFVYASVGAGLGSIFDSGETFSASGILTPQILIALIGLAVLALIPVVYKKTMKARTA
jgi:uncharacterized membrane protein YdjX (TVP38/TMEM64 family)